MGRGDFQGISEQPKAALKRKRDAWALHGAGQSHARGAIIWADTPLNASSKRLRWKSIGAARSLNLQNDCE
jgi:hypothetical protein